MSGCSPAEQDLTLGTEEGFAAASLPAIQSYQEGQASYEPYSFERMEELKGKRKFALFFHASWCPTCRKIESFLLENLAGLGQATILKADFDTELELRKEYGVAVQSTVLFFDAQGAVAQKAIDPSLDSVRSFFAL